MVVESDAFASGSSHQWLEPCQMHLASVAAAMGICLGFPATARTAGFFRGDVDRERAGEDVDMDDVVMGGGVESGGGNERSDA